MSDCFTDKESLMTYVSNLVIHFHSTNSKEAAISHSASWQSLLEAARKECLNKREKQAVERQQQIHGRPQLMKLPIMNIPVTVPSKSIQFAPTVSTSMVDTFSVASFVSVKDDEAHNSPPTKTEAAVFGSYG